MIDYPLPSKSWNAYEQSLRRLGERRGEVAAEDTRFMSAIGLLGPGEETLSEIGDAYFHNAFIADDDEAALCALRHTLLRYPPVIAVTQYLAGVPTANRQKAETVLRRHGFGSSISERKLGSFLTLLDAAGIIEYSKSSGILKVLVSPISGTDMPPSIFVSPELPYSNKIWLKRILESCEAHIYWLDKHFMHPALELIWEAADGNRVREVRILSLRLREHESKRVTRQYRDLVKELSHRSIALQWRTIDSKLIRDTHDRWVIGGQSAWNIPNVNAIYTGQHSELNVSDNRVELQAVFIDYWARSVPFVA